jgi:hypothetical protein
VSRGLELNENELKIEIEKQRGQSPYSYWTISITDDTERRKDEHEADGKNVKYWHSWKADSEVIARNVEQRFLDKGMKGGTGGGLHSMYVYIF